AVQDDRSRIGPREPDHHVERGRLAGAVRAEEPDDLAGAHVDGDVVHDPTPRVRLHQLFRAEDRRAVPVRPRAHGTAAPCPAASPSGVGGAGARPSSFPGWSTAFTRFRPPSTTLRFSSRYTTTRSPATSLAPSWRTGVSVSTTVRVPCSNTARPPV